MLLRGGRRAALLLAAAAGVGGAGVLARRDPDTAVYASASPPFRQALSAAAEGLRSGTHLSSPWLIPPPYQGFPILNSFASASVSPANLSGQGSTGISDDSRCCPGCLGRNSIAKAASAVGPAVVNISCTQDAHGWLLEESIGSGTIIDPDGTILTCAHVVADFQSTKAFVRGKGDYFLHVFVSSSFSQKVSVKLQDGREFEGVVLNADRHSDIAVVKIKSKTPLPAARLGSSSRLQPGDWVVALGCPLSLQNTVTAGIVRRVVRPWLGLKMLDLNPMIISQLKEKSSTFPDVRKGVLVPMVTPGSPAEKAGFRPGDVVVEFGGKPVESIKEIIDIMGDKVGVPFKVLVERANNVTVTLTVIPEEADASR
ncbi:putative protease Do-like 14 [Dichanthelium oligosanthes]|uniref:Putative protease Do-like 14 n=1 Tax=Dichanthelium oligosanthes TaxID=888268 RepID=A0A1E5VM16_9POAL|nr:putative protease Do-like 14 [Dichanthelium oligosanthes]